MTSIKRKINYSIDIKYFIVFNSSEPTTGPGRAIARNFSPEILPGASRRSA
jgi:hypothetical protein